MSFSTFSGPVRVGTVRENAGRNTGLVVLSQTATVPNTAVLTSPTARPLFTLPAGSRINRIMMEKTEAYAGATAVAVVLGDGTTANKYVTSFSLNTPGATGMVTQATIDGVMDVTNTSNIGTSDVTVYGTFTATGANASAGTLLVTVEYVQRATDGSANPVSV